MKYERNHRRGKHDGYALMMTLMFMSIMLVFLASAIQWTSNSAAMTDRNNSFNNAVYAAEAATEKVLAKMDQDFVNQSLGTSLNSYLTLVPDQNGWPVQYAFSDGNGVPDETSVTNLGYQVQTNLVSQFAGLYGIVNIYQVTSTAQPQNTYSTPAATVSQQFQLALIPVFQFAIFYNLNMEINPGAPMVVNGKVHSNYDLYSAPPASLVFQDYVTAAGQFLNTPYTNATITGTMPTFNLGYVANVSSLTLPIGAIDNSPSNVVQILDPPLAGENPQSPLGEQRLYNSAMLIVSNSPSGNISITTGSWNNWAPLPTDTTNILGVPSYTFATNVSFYDYREKKQVQATQIDVGKLKTWLSNITSTGGSSLNALAQLDSSHGLNSIYVENQQSAGGLSAVRVVDGASLPASGLTVATPLPLYVEGNYNLNNGDTTPGQSNTSQTMAAAMMGDSITILSGSWNDAYSSGTSLGSRPAANTTVNAAIMTGIVQTATDSSGVNHYSGGVENLPRLLENWSGQTLTYNGSMVVMFTSRYATNFWQNTGNYYNAPTRKWAFDVNFLSQNRIPPLSPSVRKLVRGQWSILASVEN